MTRPNAIFTDAIAALIVTAVALPAHAACIGDCDNSGNVTVEEIVVGVNIALGTARWQRCVRADADRDQVVSVDDLVGVVSRALAGCDDCRDSDTCGAGFDFVTHASVPFRISVSVDGTPEAGVVVSLESSRDDRGSGEAGGEYLAGATDTTGTFAGEVRIPIHLETLDAVVHLPGFRGPYSDERQRTQWGPFAPSARLHVLPAQLADLHIPLVSKERP